MNIEILQPKPFDLVSSRILIAGNAVGFEGQLSVRIGEGYDAVEGSATVGALSIAPFQAIIEVPPSAAFRVSRLFVTLSDDGGGGEAPPTVTVPVLYGPLILPGYRGYWLHTVERGDMLSAIARRYYGDASKFYVVQAANMPVVDDPDLIFPGQVLRIPRDF